MPELEQVGAPTQPVAPSSSAAVLHHHPAAPASWQADIWYRADAFDDLERVAALDTAQALLVSPSAWLALRTDWRQAGARRGLVLTGNTDARQWQQDLDGLALIAIEFGSFTDGRGFSLARQLRREQQWQGELRAIGDIRVDTLNYLARCGFDAFVLRPGEDPGLAERELARFARPYQRGYRALVPEVAA